MTVLRLLRGIGAWIMLRAVVRDERGATLVEYGLLVALIAVVVMGTMAVLGVEVNKMFCDVANRLRAGSCTP